MASLKPPCTTIGSSLVATADNGNVASWSAVGNQTFTRSYSYDPLNRISTMSDTAASQSCKGLSWTIDPWGNLTDQTLTSGSCLTLHVGVGDNNRLLSPYQYDAAGNMTYDGTHTYAYDAENHITNVDGGATASYAYDPNGRRVRKNTGGSWTEYFYDVTGNVTAEKNSSTWPVKYVYLGGQLIAQYRDNTTYSIFRDRLSSTRLITKLDKSVYDSLDFLPFGAQIAGDTGTTHKFTGKERDSESGLDDFEARYYSSALGRFTIPDWAANATPIPYADFGNPQSLNLYSYVKNNPTTLADPDGHSYCGDCGLQWLQEAGKSLINYGLIAPANVLLDMANANLTHPPQIPNLPVNSTSANAVGFVGALDRSIRPQLDQLR